MRSTPSSRGCRRRRLPRAAGASSPAFDVADEAADGFKALRALLKQHGVELVLHGHDHIHSTMWLEGAGRQIPAVGVPSASSIAHGHYPAAAFNLFSIARDGALALRADRARDRRDFSVKQIRQVTLLITARSVSAAAPQPPPPPPPPPSPPPSPPPPSLPLSPKPPNCRRTTYAGNRRRSARRRLPSLPQRLAVGLINEASGDIAACCRARTAAAAASGGPDRCSRMAAMPPDAAQALIALAVLAQHDGRRVVQEAAEGAAAERFVIARVEDELVPEIVGDLRRHRDMAFATPEIGQEELAQTARNERAVLALEAGMLLLQPFEQPGRPADKCG